MKKTSVDKNQGINKPLPNKIEVTDVGSSHFGIMAGVYILDGLYRYYLFEEYSGIIRSGIRISLYKEYRNSKFFKDA